MRPLNRPQRYLKIRGFRWAPYLRTKPRTMMPYEVRILARQQEARQLKYLEQLTAQVQRIQATVHCDDPTCTVCNAVEEAAKPVTLQ